MSHRGRTRGGQAAARIALCATLLATATVADEDETSVAQVCLHHPTIDRTKILDGRNILFVTHDDRIYHNLLPRQCPGVRRNTLLSYNIANAKLCAGNTFTVILEVGTNRIPTYVCELGMFRPVSEHEAEDLVALTEEEPRRRRSARRRNEPDMIQTEVVELPRAETAAPAAPPPAP